MSSVPSDSRRAFEHVVESVIEPLRRFLRRRTDPATADDVLSETLMVLWRRIDEVPADNIPWAIGVARLQLANIERAQRRQDRLVAKIIDIDPPSVSYCNADAEDSLSDDVARAMSSLSSSDAELLRLWAWDGLQPRQISVVLGISTNAATVRLHRSKKKFAAAIGKHSATFGHDEVREGTER